MEATCKNCERELTESYAFCPGCGQKAHLHRLSWHEIGHELVHYFTHADKGIFSLLKDLATKNGVVAREYVEGQRRKYFPPLNFFLIIAGIFVIASMWKEPEKPIDVMKAYPQLSKIESKQELEAQKIGYERALATRHWTKKYSNLMAMAALPITTFIYFLFYVRGRYNYVEHLFAGMYLIGFCLLVFALVIMPIRYLLGIPEMYGVYAFMVFQIVYASIFYYRFMSRTRKSAYIVSSLASISGFLVWSTISVGVIQIYIRTGFWGILA